MENDTFDFDKSASYDYDVKKAFHLRAKRQLRRVAKLMGIPKGTYEVRSNLGGIAVSGEVTLHSNTLYVQVFQPAGYERAEILYRTCKGREDYTGGRNNVLPGNELNDASKVAVVLMRFLAFGNQYEARQDNWN